MAEKDMEQPVATSVTEPEVQEYPPEVVDAVEAEPAPEPEPESPAPSKGKGSKSIPKPRFDEVVYERNQLREETQTERNARLAAERRAQELEFALRQATGQVSQGTGYDEDPLYAEVKQTRTMLEEMKREQAYMRDARQREEFWREHDYVSEDVIEAVETKLSEFRSKGLDAVKRKDLLAYEIGSRELPNVAKRVKQPAAIPPVNRVAVVEGRPSAAKVPTKRLEDMTPAELNALSLEQLRELMKGKTF